MRFAEVTFGVGLSMFAAAGAGLLGTWALVASTIVMGVAALVAVVVMEERDYSSVEGLYPAGSDPVEAAVAGAATEERLAQAA